jgi:4-carboxymuconolactone decarboxylase
MITNKQKPMKQLLSIILFITSISLQSTAQQNSFFAKDEKAPNVHHTGDVWLKELNAADSIFNNSIAIAIFAAGARLNWHKHPGGQILMITDGEGYYQERGKPKQMVHKGEVIKCLPNVEHWHGATPTTGVTYIASSPTQKGKTIWLDKVTDEAYNSIPIKTTTMKNINAEQDIINLSKNKWRWMSERNVDSLNLLFNEKAMFVHMGATFTKAQELNVIREGNIQYKKAEIQETSVQFIDNTAILLNKIKLTAIVGGNEVVNPFVVTEVYVLQNGNWTLGSMSFTKLLVPEVK